MPCNTAETAIVLYRHVGCPFCERVVSRALDLGIDFRLRFVPANHSDRDIIKRLSGSRTVPLFIDDTRNTAISESSNILAYLDATYGDEI